MPQPHGAARVAAAAGAWALVAWLGLVAGPRPCAGAAFHLHFNHTVKADNVTGRLYVVLSSDPSGTTEPRLQISTGPDTQQIFGTDVDNLAPGQIGIIGEATLGYPLDTLGDVPEGDYWVQGVLQPYQQYQPGPAPQPVWLPRTVINQYGGALNGPGTIYSKPMKAHVAVGPTDPIEIRLDQVVPPATPPALNATQYIKYVSVKSKMLSDFWKTDVMLEACVLLPWGWDNHTDVHYPLVVYHGHYTDDWETPVGFSETPAPGNLTGYDLVQAQYAHYLYLNWTQPSGGPFHNGRVIIMTVKHPNPYYDDSYAVDSANLGPYGTAIVEELVPAVEAQFRGIGQGWARALYGGSTGGWEALAMQVFYRQNFSGAWALCPDPVDFRRFTSVDLYSHRNAYFVDAPWKRTPRPAQRDLPDGLVYPGYGATDGFTVATVREMNRLELALGEKTRSGGQYDAWEAVFSPAGPDGYPKRVWDKATGVIDPDVVAYWREHYDLSHLLQQNWAAWAKDLQGKLNVYVGMSDTYFLNDAVYLLEEALRALDPPFQGSVVYGQHAGRGFAHCWSGDSDHPNSVARLTINQRLVPLMVARFVAAAPKDAPMDWRY